MPHNTPYTDGLLDKNTYYHAKNILAYPASNSVDFGKLVSELNLRNTTINITDMNYVVSPNPGGYDISLNNNKIDIQPGKAVINGFEILTNEVISYRLPTAEELYTGTKYKHKYEGFALLCLHTIFDSLKNLSGNIQVGDDWYFEGIHVCYPSTEEYENNENEYLLLGGVTPDGETKINDEKFDRINADKVLVRMTPDPETGAPPIQSSNLLEFINNYLHGYWVSKAGDHEYGNLTFRKKPNKYLDPLFDYNTEEPLNDTRYAIKLGRTYIDSALTEETRNGQEGYMNVKFMLDDKTYEQYVHIVPQGAYYKHQILNDDSVDFNVFQGYVNIEGMPYTPKDGLGWLFVSGDRDENVECENNIFLNRITSNANYTDLIGGPYSVDRQTKDSGCFIWDFSQNNNTGRSNNYFKIQFNTTRGTENTGDNYFYVGAVDLFNNIQNDLYSTNQSIRTAYKMPKTAGSFYIDISAVKQQITFATERQTCYIHLRSDENIANEQTWTNVLDIGDNVEIKDNLWTHGYIVAGTKKNVTNETSEDIGNDPSQIEVPDFVNVGGSRKLQPGDIYGTQVWTSVYNDISEIFDFSDSIVGKEIIGLVVAQDNKNLDKFTIADKHNTNIVGIVSECPSICMGGLDCKNGVPVALAGRVKVRYEGKLPKPGDFVGLSKTTPGYVTVCKHTYKYRCGKTLRVLDKQFIEVLVLL